MASTFSMRREYPACSAVFFSGFVVTAFTIAVQFVGLAFDEPRFEVFVLRGLCVFLGAMIIYPRFKALGVAKSTPDLARQPDRTLPDRRSEG